MGELMKGDDGLPAEKDVGEWVADKHHHLTEYLRYQAMPRRDFIGAGKAGASYIDLFCGPGRARVKGTNSFVDGSAIAAWKASLEQGAPFTYVYVADKDDARRKACVERLRRLKAPVIEVEGDASSAAAEVMRLVNPYGLHFAFIDPYSLGALRIEMLQALMAVKRMDVMVHISAMDLFRNLDMNLAGDRHEFDQFAPGWQSHVRLNQPQDDQRRLLIDYWKSLVDERGFDANAEMQAIKNSVNRDLYWLLVLSRHTLGTKFWNIVVRTKQQRDLF